MLPAFPIVTTQTHLDSDDVDLDDLNSTVLSNKLIISKWLQTTRKPLNDEIKRTKNKILTESKKEINYVNECLKQKLLNKKMLSKCQFQDDNKLMECKRSNLPFSNYCNEHISQSKDQFLFKRCSVKLKDNKQCSNSLLNVPEDKMCQEHLQSFKNGENVDNNIQDKESAKNCNGTKSKRKYNKNAVAGNENKPRKTRKKKDQQTNLSDSLNNLINTVENGNDINKTQQSFAFNSCYPNDLNDNSTANFGFNPVDQLIDHYTPTLVAGNLGNGNLNQLSTLNNSEDSLAGIVNNSTDLASVQFEESDLNEILGKIPDDAFNDIFINNLSTDCADLKSIDNIAFNNNCDVSIEPSIASNCFNSADNPQINNLIYSQKPSQQKQPQQQPPILNSTTQDVNLMSSSEMIYLPNSLINNQSLQSNEQIKPMNYFNENNICAITNSNFNSYNVLDFKQQNSVTFPSQMVHQPSPPTYNSTYLQSNAISSNYPAIGQQIPQQAATTNTNHLLNGNQQILNDHLNHLQQSPVNNSILLNDEQNYQNGNLNSLNNVNNLPTITSPNQSYSVHNTISSITSNKHELQDKKFNLFTNNCKINYGNIYDDLPSFEPNNHINGTSTLPSFSMINIVKKNRIESR